MEKQQIKNRIRKAVTVTLVCIYSISIFPQTTWPSKVWDSAVNISSVFPSTVAELSGLYWNAYTNRLYCVADEGVLYVLSLNKTTNTFSLVKSVGKLDGPEGVTQVNNQLNEFYTIDENSYEIRRYTHNADFSTVIKANYWYLLQSPSPMTDTGNTGPEGIAFVPDSYLSKIGFLSSVTGKVYTSTRGMGGLIFIAHQDGGYVWVFDINPTSSNNFLYVGKYKTNRDESCDLTFDQSTGLLYILHNTGDNYLELTNLKTTVVSGEYKFTTSKEYYIPNPASGSSNIEGFAITPKFPDSGNVNAWLCRDVKSSSSDQSDCIRWFYPFTADGTDIRTDVPDLISQGSDAYSISPNPATVALTIKSLSESAMDCRYEIYSSVGQLIMKSNITDFPANVDIRNLQNGIYFVKVSSDNMLKTVKTIIKTN